MLVSYLSPMILVSSSSLSISEKGHFKNITILSQRWFLKFRRFTRQFFNTKIYFFTWSFSFSSTKEARQYAQLSLTPPKNSRCYGRNRVFLAFRTFFLTQLPSVAILQLIIFLSYWVKRVFLSTSGNSLIMALFSCNKGRNSRVLLSLSYMLIFYRLVLRADGSTSNTFTETLNFSVDPFGLVSYAQETLFCMLSISLFNVWLSRCTVFCSSQEIRLSCLKLPLLFRFWSSAFREGFFMFNCFFSVSSYWFLLFFGMVILSRLLAVILEFLILLSFNLLCLSLQYRSSH